MFDFDSQMTFTVMNDNLLIVNILQTCIFQVWPSKHSGRPGNYGAGDSRTGAWSRCLHHPHRWWRAHSRNGTGHQKSQTKRNDHCMYIGNIHKYILKKADFHFCHAVSEVATCIYLLNLKKEGQKSKERLNKMCYQPDLKIRYTLCIFNMIHVVKKLSCQ